MIEEGVKVDYKKQGSQTYRKFSGHLNVRVLGLPTYGVFSSVHGLRINYEERSWDPN